MWLTKRGWENFVVFCFLFFVFFFSVAVFQDHFLFTSAGLQSHTVHYYFSRTWKTITAVIERAWGKTWLQFRKTKDRKADEQIPSFITGDWEVIAAGMTTRIARFLNNIVLFFFLIYESNTWVCPLEETWKNIYKYVKRKIKNYRSLKNYLLMYEYHTSRTVVHNYFLL